jgi:Cupredoxin-like domain
MALALVLAGCSHTRVLGADRTLHMSIREYRLNPQSIRATPGVVSIVVHNDGVLTHNLAVSANGQQVAATKPIPPGASTELDLNLAPGNYSMASTILSDQTLGAYGTLTVS